MTQIVSEKITDESLRMSRFYSGLALKSIVNGDSEMYKAFNSQAIKYRSDYKKIIESLVRSVDTLD